MRDEYRRIMDRISQDPNWVWVVPFRCDAPARARHITQSVKPIFSDSTCTGFLFHAVEQTSQQRPPMDIYDFKKLRALAERNPNLPGVSMCSWCQRVQSSQTGAGIWMSAEDYYAAGGGSAVRITHSICDTCLATADDTFLM